jgi:acyl-coenzyme A thioesterase PaaI-like protein
MNTTKLLLKARSSGFYRWLLNQALGRMIPFNRPHGFEVLKIEDFTLKILLPYRRKNLNHIRGLHACALATVSEFATGFLLISKLDPKKFRLIMQRLEMDYHYQGKMNAIAEFSISEQWLAQNIFTPLLTSESVVVNCQIKIHDQKGNHLSTGNVYWQIKDWTKVKTKT